MRIRLHVVLDREKSNEMVLDGTLGPTIEGILAEVTIRIGSVLMVVQPNLGRPGEAEWKRA